MIRFLLASGILIVGILLFNKFKDSNPKLAIKSAEVNDSQIPYQRDWISKRLVEIPFIGNINDSLFRPIEFDSFEDTLYVTDYGDMKIKRFTTSGEFIDQFGKYIGRGPSDLLGPLDLFVSNRNLYALDRDHSIKIFDLDKSDKTQTIRVNQNSYELLSLDKIFVTQTFIDYKFFSIINKTDTANTFYFSGLAEEQQTNILSLGGYLVPSLTDNEFIYIPKYGSYLFYYTLDGNNSKTIQTIDRFEIPKSQNLSTGVRVPDPNQIIQNVAYTDSLLFILNSRRGIDDHTREEFRTTHSFVDVYSITGERYYITMLMPFHSDGLAIVKDEIFLLHEKEDKIYRYMLPNLN